MRFERAHAPWILRCVHGVKSGWAKGDRTLADSYTPSNQIMWGWKYIEFAASSGVLFFNMATKSSQWGLCKTTLSVHKHMTSCEHSRGISYLSGTVFTHYWHCSANSKVTCYKLWNILQWFWAKTCNSIHVFVMHVYMQYAVFVYI